ncbi:MAG TPA: hypothetical protein VGF13_21295 [Verrucomicrobiae bacterium]
MTNSNSNPTTVAVKSMATTEHRRENQHHDRSYTNISGPEAAIIAAVLATLIGACGWVVVHRNTRTREQEARAHADYREKEARRADLLATLKHWENTFVVVMDSQESKRLYYHGGGMKELAVAAEKFRGHVSEKHRAEYDRLNHQMSAMNPETLDSNGADQRRGTICGAIVKFYDFVRAA